MLGQDLILLNLQVAAASGDTFTNPAAAPTVGVPQDFSDSEDALVVLNVQAITGTTPTLTVDLYTYDPVLKAWIRFNGFALVSAVGITTLPLPPGYLPNKVGVKYTLGGTTPAVTASVFASAKRK